MSVSDTTALEANGSIAETVSQLVEVVEEQAKQIEQLQTELAETRQQQAEDRQRITAVEQDVEDTETESDAPGVNEGKTTMQQPSTTPETPLEDLATVPERVLENESANTRRAVFVARDLEAYATSVPAGRAMSSTEVRRVLQAGTDASGHTQTVARVMSLLDDLGGDNTKIVERHGTRRIVFSDELVSRLTRLFSGEPHGGDEVRA